MKPQRRWMQWVLEQSAEPDFTLPWQRGARQTATRR
jgi:hypothetical protein